MIRTIIYLLLTVSGLSLFKAGSSGTAVRISLERIQFAISPLALLGIFCYMGSFLLWLTIVRDNDLSYIFPIVTGLVTVLTFVSGLILFNETISVWKVLGLALTITGIIIMQIRR